MLKKDLTSPAGEDFGEHRVSQTADYSASVCTIRVHVTANAIIKLIEEK